MRKVIASILLLALCSCSDDPAANQKNDPLAAKFLPVKDALQLFANKHHAKTSTVWSKVQRGDSSKLDSLLVKLIVWSDGDIRKAILFQQHNDVLSVDTAAWDLVNLAWLKDKESGGKPTYEKHLLTNVSFPTITNNIQQYLAASEKNLGEIKREDFK